MKKVSTLLVLILLVFSLNAQSQPITVLYQVNSKTFSFPANAEQKYEPSRDVVVRLIGVNNSTVIPVSKTIKINFKFAGHPENIVQEFHQLATTANTNDAGIISKVANGNLDLSLKDALDALDAESDTKLATLERITFTNDDNTTNFVLRAKQEDPTMTVIPGRPHFIPPTEVERQWFENAGPASPALQLNKHTRWAIVYDYRQTDPVAVFKRTNKKVSSSCSDCFYAAPSFSNDKRSPIALMSQAVAIQRELDALLSLSTLSSEDKETAEDLKTKLATSRGNILKIDGEKGSKDDAKKLNDLGRKAALLNLSNNRPAAVQSPVSYTSTFPKSPSCCDPTYCVKEKKRFAPTVGRSVVVSLINYHPYRDSAVLSVTYGDRFLEQGSLFTSVFNGRISRGTAAQPADIVTKVDEQSTDTSKPKTQYFPDFETLAKELEQYYRDKFNVEVLPLGVVANGVAYINGNMRQRLGITEFSGDGIIKRAEALADLVTQEGKSVSDFLALARRAATAYEKIARYRRFESQNFLVKNRDDVNLDLKRFSNGKLLTSAEESLRTYTISGGFKIDFSVGLLQNFLIDKAFTTKSTLYSDTTYYALSNGIVQKDSIVNIDTVRADKIILDDHGKFNVQPVVLMHFYWKTGTDFNASLTAGISINRDALPRYLFGGSILLGKNSRWVITGGMSLGPVKDLASGLKEGDRVKLSSFASSTLPTREVWDSSGFIAVSWNFTGFNVTN